MPIKPEFGPRKPIGVKIQTKMKPQVAKSTVKLASGLSEEAIAVFKLARKQHKAMIAKPVG